MSRILCLLLFLVIINSLHAQTELKNGYYLGSDVNLGNYLGLDVDVNYIYSEKYSLRLGYSGHVRKATSLPYDYSAGLVNAMLFGLAQPVDQMENYLVTAGKIYKLNKKGTIRMNLSFGLGYTTIQEPGNWQRSQNSFLVENYTWDYEKYNTVSLILSPRLEFPLTRLFGLYLSPMLQINKDRTFVGVGIGNFWGQLRKRY